jgi:peptidyl-prolyl cis-trans isomerase A (cyclophilin A)
LKKTTLALTLSLAACGGNGVAPVSSTFSISTLTAQAEPNNTVTLTATAVHNQGATQYCFKTDPNTPLPSDACFQSSPQKTGVILAPNTTHYAWATDTTGKVSVPLKGPCSTSGYAASDASTKNTVCMLTDKGELVLELNATQAPISTENFLKYTNDGFYNDTTFHRVISNFMVQGGGYTYDNINGYQAKPSTYAPITLESTATTGLGNTRGTVAMARSQDPNSATNEFFINVVDNAFLNAPGSDGLGGYAVFGKVISGLATADTIKITPTNSSDQPITPIKIQWAYQIK